jgi:hypothetical protein
MVRPFSTAFAPQSDRAQAAPALKIELCKMLETSYGVEW